MRSDEEGREPAAKGIGADRTSIGDWLVALGLSLFVGVIPLVWSTVVGAAFFTPKAAAVYPVVLLIMLGVVLRSRHEELRPDRLDLAVLAFVALAALATLLGGTPVASLFGPYRQGTGLGMFLLAGGLLVAGRRRHEADVAIASQALVAGAVVLTVLLWLQHAETGWAISNLGIPASGRPGASMGSPLWAGAYVGAGLVAALVLCLAARGRWAPVYAAAAGVCLTGLFLTSSRGAWLGTALAVAVALVLAWPARSRLWTRVAALTLVLLLAGSLTLVARTTPVSAEEAAGNFITSGRPTPTRESDLGRLGLYRTALRAAGEKPVLGWGPGNFQLAWQHSVDAESMAPNLDSWGTDAHDLPLEVLVTTGTVGALSLLAVTALLALALVPLVRRQELPETVPLLAGIALVVPLCLNPQSIYLTPLLFLFAGLASPRTALLAPSPVGDGPIDELDAARSSLPAWVRPALGTFIGAALLVSVTLGVVALQADARFLRGLSKNDASLAAAAADRLPVYPLMYFMAGQALAAAPQTAASAVEVYERGLRLRPDDAYGLQSLAGAHMGVSQPEEALSAAEHAIRVFPVSAMARFVKARALLALGQREEALRLSREGLTVATPMARSYYLAAETFFMAGDTATAKEILEEGLTAYPGSASLESALDLVQRGTGLPRP